MLNRTVNETPLFKILESNLDASCGTVLDGQFNWGGFLQKSNGGVQRSASYGWKS